MNSPSKRRNDGVCWLKVAVINRQGKQEPGNILQGPPDRKIVIDTIKPVVRAFTAQRQGDEIVAAWDILEAHFDPKDFHLEYQPKDNPSAFWTTIPATPGLIGQQRFRPTAASPLMLRLTVKDLAGNASFGVADVPGDIKTVSYNPPAAPTSINVLPPALPPPGADTFNLWVSIRAATRAAGRGKATTAAPQQLGTGSLSPA